MWHRNGQPLQFAKLPTLREAIGGDERRLFQHSRTESSLARSVGSHCYDESPSPCWSSIGSHASVVVTATPASATMSMLLMLR